MGHHIGEVGLGEGMGKIEDRISQERDRENCFSKFTSNLMNSTKLKPFQIICKERIYQG